MNSEFNFPTNAFGYVPGTIPAKIVYANSAPTNPVEALFWMNTTPGDLQGTLSIRTSIVDNIPTWVTLNSEGLLRSQLELVTSVVPIGGVPAKETSQMGFFADGIVLKRKNHLVVDADGQAWFWKGSFPKTVPANSSPQTSGGLGPSGWSKVITAFDSGNFQTGFTATTANQIFLWPSAIGGNNQKYFWKGSFPKTVPANSSPMSTGGIGDNAWESTNDLQDKLSNGTATIFGKTAEEIATLEDRLQSEEVPEGAALVRYSVSLSVKQALKTLFDKVEEYDSRFLSIKDFVVDFGGVRGGIEDNSEQLTEAISWVFGEDNRQLTIPFGQTFRISERVLHTVTSTLRRNCFIEGFGSSFTFSDGAGITIDVADTALLSRLSIKGLRFIGGTDQLVLSANSNSNFIYNLTLDSNDFQSFNGDGLRLEGNVFEIGLNYNSGSALSTNLTGYGIHLVNVGSGIISSVDVFGGTWRGGKNCFYAQSPVSDFRMFGGTYLFAEEHGVKVDNAIGASIFGTHVEGNWESASSIATGGAGLRMVGQGEIHGVYGTSNSSQKQRYVVEVVANNILITGGGKSGNTFKYGKYTQNAGRTLVLIGEQALDYDSVGDVFATRIGEYFSAPHVGYLERFKSYNPTITIDLNQGSYIRVAALTGDCFVSAPTNRLTSTGMTHEFYIGFEQDATGGRSVTWDAIYSLPPEVEVNSTPYYHTIFKFMYTATKWRYAGHWSSP